MAAATTMAPSRPPAPSAATALLSLLEEPRAALRAHALRALHDVVDREWSAVASSVAAIEALYEDETFEAREDAALLASKVRARGEESAKRRRGWERDADLVARDEDRARPGRRSRDGAPAMNAMDVED